MNKLNIVVLIASVYYIVTQFFNNVFTTLYEKYMKLFVGKYITEIIFVVVCIFIITISYFTWKYYLKYKQLKKENEKYKEYINHGVSVMALKVEIEDILTNILQEAKDVSMYIVHKNTIYNFSTLPYDTTGIHHQNKTFTLDESTIIGKAFLNKEKSIYKLSDSNQISRESKESINAYNLDPNDYLITIPYLNNDNSALFSLQLITHEYNDFKMFTIKNHLNKLKNPLENLMKHPDWENLIPKFKTDSTEINGGFLFFDLSNSSNLLELLNLEKAKNEINNFIAIMCDVAIDKGGKIDKYTGDGGFITFIQDTQSSNFEQNLIDTSIEMVKEMSKLRHIWTEQYNLTKESVDKFKIRIGISSGKVRPFTIGHKDYKYDTYFGKPIYTASHLCEGSDSILRDRILIDEELKEKVKFNGIKVIKYEAQKYQFSTEIYEISLI